MRLRLPALAVVVALTGCGDDDEPSAAEQRAELVAELTADLRAETDGALDEETATCVATELVDGFGEERFDEIVSAAGGDGDEELRDQVVDVFASCDALDAAREGP